MFENHIPLDIISIDADFSKYKTLVMPAFNLMKPEMMILNHNSHEVVLDLKGEYTDLLTKSKIHFNLVLPPFGVGVLI